MSLCVSLGIYLGRGVQQLYGDIKKKKNDKTHKRQRQKHPRDTSDSPHRSENDVRRGADSGCEPVTSRPEGTSGTCGPNLGIEDSMHDMVTTTHWRSQCSTSSTSRQVMRSEDDPPSYTTSQSFCRSATSQRSSRSSHGTDHSMDIIEIPRHPTPLRLGSIICDDDELDVLSFLLSEGPDEPPPHYDPHAPRPPSYAHVIRSEYERRRRRYVEHMHSTLDDETQDIYHDDYDHRYGGRRVSSSRHWHPQPLLHFEPRGRMGLTPAEGTSVQMWSTSPPRTVGRRQEHGYNRYGGDRPSNRRSMSVGRTPFHYL